jgi:wyosine [tRNA(Phe)-imidazoG37] synthetase (radical SAM superfamily)
MQNEKTFAFGPVPSRRLGRSLGINHIPPKTCSYSCVYCQLGKTSNILVDRQAFYEPKDILMKVERTVSEAATKNERIDYLTFVPDGEPTLDINIGEEISLLRHVGIPIAVMTNASLLWRDDVREDLLEADFVSLKVDTVNQELWKSINRPHKSLRLNVILNGIKEFAEMFKGAIASETMLIDGINYEKEFRRIAEFLTELKKLDKVYIAIPTRPPTEKWVRPANEEVVNVAFQIFSEKIGADRVEYLIGYEGNAFAFTRKVEEDLLSIMAVHPMRKEAVIGFLKKANADWRIIEELLDEDELMELEYEGNKYYMRKMPGRRQNK